MLRKKNLLDVSGQETWARDDDWLNAMEANGSSSWVSGDQARRKNPTGVRRRDVG